MDDLIKRLQSYTNVREPLVAARHDVVWPMSDLREAAAALSEAQATIARLEAERADLAFAGRALQGWTPPDVAINFEGAYRAIKTIADRLAALSPREGEG